jgi:hypothetical protein
MNKLLKQVNKNIVKEFHSILRDSKIEKNRLIYNFSFKEREVLIELNDGGGDDGLTLSIDDILVRTDLPVSGEIFNYKDIRKKIHKLCRNYYDKRFSVYDMIFADGAYLILDKESFDIIIKEFRENVLTKVFYQWRKFDCDDFQRLFQVYVYIVALLQEFDGDAGIAVFGMRYSYTRHDGEKGGHALNIIGIEDKMYVIEPQNTSVYKEINILMETYYLKELNINYIEG